MKRSSEDEPEITRIPDLPVGPERAKPSRTRRAPIVIPDPVPPDIEITPTSPTDLERRDAKSIADEVVRLFRYALLGFLAIGFASVVATAVNPSVASSILGFLEGYLKATGGFLGQVFGSLLGLIIGYYFGRSKG